MKISGRRQWWSAAPGHGPRDSRDAGARGGAGRDPRPPDVEGRGGRQSRRWHPLLPLDVTDFVGTEAAIARAAEDLGAVHFGVNTAGGGIAKRTLTKEGRIRSTSFAP
jgi:NAD(P)-dependent dehydrogenase (short-subunit alcohol dehydrogenase family)